MELITTKPAPTLRDSEDADRRMFYTWGPDRIAQELERSQKVWRRAFRRYWDLPLKAEEERNTRWHRCRRLMLHVEAFERRAWHFLWAVTSADYAETVAALVAERIGWRNVPKWAQPEQIQRQFRDEAFRAQMAATLTELPRLV